MSNERNKSESEIGTKLAQTTKPDSRADADPAFTVSPEISLWKK